MSGDAGTVADCVRAEVGFSPRGHTYPAVKRAFGETYDGSEEGRARWLADDDLKPFGDTVDELSRWHCFKEERLKRAPRDQAQARPSAAWLDNGRCDQPIRSTKIGRNMSCPCGSGKKFKKCCAA